MLPGIRTDRAFRSRAELRTLVEAVRLAPASTMERDWIEWKRAEKLSAKSCLVDIAHHIIGFANREPDKAAAVAEGCANLLIGVEPGQLSSVEVIDIAQLEQGIVPYLGHDGPRYRPDYVDVDACTVLVITVEAPRWGDPIYFLRQSYLSSDKRAKGYVEGTVYIRKNGRTENPPDEASWKMLQQRLLRGGVRIDLDVSWADGDTPRIVAVDTSPPLLEKWLTRERRRLLAPLETVERRRSGLGSSDFVSRIALEALSGPAFGAERRDPKDYRAEVERYLIQAEERLPARTRNFALSQLAPDLVLAVTNGTDRNFRGVQVEIIFSGALAGHLDRREPWKDVRFPAAPTLYGTIQSITNTFAAYTPFITPSPVSPARLWIDHQLGRCRVTFAPIDLRPHHTARLPAFRLLALPEAAGTTIMGGWHATATSADGLIQGRVDIAVDGQVISGGELLEDDPDPVVIS